MSKELWWSRRKKDFKIEWFSGTGSGGQHRNKHQNCCRMTDIETNIITIGQDHKERSRNQKDAFHRMIEKLKQHYEDQEEKEEPGRSSDKQATTRSYDKHSNRVTDHVTGLKYSYKHTVGRGDLSEIITDRRKFSNEN